MDGISTWADFTIDRLPALRWFASTANNYDQLILKDYFDYLEHGCVVGIEYDKKLSECGVYKALDSLTVVQALALKPTLLKGISNASKC